MIEFPICTKLTPSLNVYSLFTYSNVLKDLLHEVKFHSNQHLALQLSPLFFRIFNYFSIDKRYSLLYVPISKQRKNKRGFNQVELLANSISVYFNELLTISRIESTRALYDLDRDQRQDEMVSAFSSNIDFSNKKICIVDDIMTSGSTLINLSNYLYNQGALDIKAITLAYKI